MQKKIMKTIGFLFLIIIPLYMLIAGIHYGRLYSSPIPARVVNLEIVENVNRGRSIMNVSYEYTINGEKIASEIEEFSRKIKVGDIEEIAVNVNDYEEIFPFSKKEFIFTIILLGVSCFFLGVVLLKQ